MIKLTEHQKKILDQSIKILKENNKLIIEGSAGVGKTTLVNSLIKELKINKILNSGIILCTAPTNKAVSILKNKVEGYKVSFKTIHSALKMVKKIDKETGEIYFTNKNKLFHEKLKNASILIVDETSMLNKDIIEAISTVEVLNENIKFIFIGDIKQLPPIGEEVSEIFKKNYPKVILKEIVRQNNFNPIISISQDLSLICKKIDNVKKDGNKKIGYLFTNNYGHIIKRLTEVNGTDELKYLSWTNRNVNIVNSLVRSILYKTPKKIEKGETIIFDSPYLDYNTNEEYKIEYLGIKTEYFYFKIEDGIEIKEKIKFYICNNEVKIIHEESELKFNKIKSSLYRNCKNKKLKWKFYHDLLDFFVKFKYNHALTVHKSQGSTYKKVILNMKDINLNEDIKEKKKLIYTGITRASDLVIFYNT